MILQSIFIPSLMVISSLGYTIEIEDIDSMSSVVVEEQVIIQEPIVTSADNLRKSTPNLVYVEQSQPQIQQRQRSLREGEVYAIIIPVHEADLSSGVNATIRHINYSPGESFKKGDKLLSFDCRNIEIDIKQAKAELQATRTAYISNQELDELKAISKVEFEKSKTDYEQAEAEVEALDYQLGKCTIIAPFNGEVVAKHANENENVKIDDPLLSIISIKDVEVQMFVPSTWLNWLRKGAEFSLKLQEMSQPIDAKVVKIAGRVDPASQSVVIYGKLNKMPEGILAGMSGVATFKHK